MAALSQDQSITFIPSLQMRKLRLREVNVTSAKAGI